MSRLRILTLASFDKTFFFVWLVFEKSKVKKKEAENRPFLDKQVRAKEFIQTTYKLANPTSYKLADSKSNIKFKFKPNNILIENKLIFIKRNYV